MDWAQVRLGPSGAEEVLGIGKITDAEHKALDEAIPQLRGNIDTGVKFAKGN